MLFPGNGDLAGRCSQKLVAGDLFDDVWIFRTQQCDAVLEPGVVVFDVGELFLRYGQSCTRIGQRENAARAPDEVVAEIQHGRGADRGYHKSAKKACHAASDSHTSNESHTKSDGQEECEVQLRNTPRPAYFA